MQTPTKTGTVKEEWITITLIRYSSDVHCHDPFNVPYIERRHEVVASIEVYVKEQGTIIMRVGTIEEVERAVAAFRDRANAADAGGTRIDRDLAGTA